ncbi:MAG: hypothetical protein RML84_00855 [Anaerolineae bacterium]|nr:hypothetical protein [Anaerolineae bacterium]
MRPAHQRKRLLAPAFWLIVVGASVMFSPAIRARAEHEPPVCVFACNPRWRQCLVYEASKLPKGYIPVRRTPYGYQRVYVPSVCQRVCLGAAEGCLP